MDIKIGKLSLKELKALSKKVDAAIASHEQRQQREARRALEKVAKDYGMAIDDIIATTPKKRKGPAKSKAKPSAPKYRNPKDPKQTWSGRGRRPEWFKSALNSGKKEADLAI